MGNCLSLVKENRRLHQENGRLRRENEDLRKYLASFSKSESSLRAEPSSSPPKYESSGESPQKRTSFADEAFLSRRPSATAVMPPPEGRASRPSELERITITNERRKSLGSLPIAMRAETIMQGVLPLAAAFDKFDNDKSGGISVNELKAALEYLGVHSTEGTAGAILRQYDMYPDKALDVKEFANVVRDVQLMMQHDTNGDGMLDRVELRSALDSLGLEVSLDQVDKVLDRFDVDGNGSIDVIELGSLVRTTQAFLRYDTDGSGSIDVDELRDALRKLGVRAGQLEAANICRRYDADESGTLELHEFATLVRDLQLYAQFDSNLDGEIDAAELHEALECIGVNVSADDAASILFAWNVGSGSALGSGGAAPGTGLDLPSFAQLLADLRAFKDADTANANALSLEQVLATLKALGAGNADAASALGVEELKQHLHDLGGGHGALRGEDDPVGVVDFVRLVCSLTDNNGKRVDPEEAAVRAGTLLGPEFHIGNPVQVRLKA